MNCCEELKPHVYKLTNHLQVILGHLELGNPKSAMVATKEAIKMLFRMMSALEYLCGEDTKKDAA